MPVDETTSEAPCLFPTLRCEDADAMIRWLTQVLGFRERVVHRDDDGVRHAELILGNSILMLGQNREESYGAMVGEGRKTDALYVSVTDPDGLFERVKASGAEIEAEPFDTGYGSRDFMCRDPEGNLWGFGTYWPKASEPPDPA